MEEHDQKFVVMWAKLVEQAELEKARQKELAGMLAELEKDRKLEHDQKLVGFVKELTSLVESYPQNRDETPPIGSSGYLDQFTEKTPVIIGGEKQELSKALAEHRIIWGRDKYGRFYILFMFSTDGNPDKHITCFFQRYSNDEKEVQCAGRYNFMRTSGGMEMSQIGALFSLLENGFITMTKTEAYDNRMYDNYTKPTEETKDEQITFRLVSSKP